MMVSKTFPTCDRLQWGALEFYDAALNGDDYRLRAVAHVQPPQDDIDVPFDGAARDVERVGNLLIAESSSR